MLSRAHPVTKSDFDHAGWQQLIDTCAEKSTEAYREIFQREAEKAQKRGDKNSETVFALLMDLVSPILSGESPDRPYLPMSESNRGRTALPDDFTDEQLEHFVAILPGTTDPEMRARMADILWLRKRGHGNIEVAVDGYLESAKRLDGESWSPTFERVQRAVQLAALRGRESETFKKVERYVDELLSQEALATRANLHLRLLELMHEQRFGDPSRCLARAIEHSKRAAEGANWHQQRDFLDVAANWAHRANDETTARSCRHEAAETYVRLALERESGPNPSYLAAAVFYRDAIHAYRNAGNKERSEDLRRDLDRCQTRMMGEMKSHEVAIEAEKVAEIIANATKAVQGKSFEDAVLTFISFSAIQRKADIRQQVERIIQEAPLSHFVSGTFVNEFGRTIANRPSALTTNGEEREAAIKCEMYELASRGQEVTAHLAIEAARKQMYLDHPVRKEDFRRLIQHSPFVPPGREVIYARGLFAGFVGDWMGSAHLLIPQFENSIRYVLYQHKVIASGFDSDGIQQEWDLNATLYHAATAQILGEDLAFELQGLLVAKCGSNLRNVVAHGLVDQVTLQHSNKVRYFWWLTLRMVILPLLQVQRPA